MPGGLLDLFGIDPIANRQRKLVKEESAAERQLRLTLAAMQNRGGIDIEKLRGSNAASLEDKRSGNTIKEKGVEAANETAKLTHQQVLAILSKLNVPYSKENHALVDQALTDPRIQGALQEQMTQNRVVASPEFQTANKQGAIAERLAQGFKNQAATTTTTPPGGITVMPPSGFAKPPEDLGQHNQIIGGGNEQSVEETSMDYPDGKGGILSLPGQPKVTNKMLPGRVRPRIDPALLNSMPPNLGGTVAGNVQAMPPQMGLGGTMNPELLEQIRRTLSQQPRY